MKKILVTGACGWLGIELVRALLKRGDTVVATDIAISPAVATLASSQPGLILAPADLGEWRQVMDMFRSQRPDAVIHAAALVGVVQCADIPVKASRVNIEGSINLFEAMRLEGVKRVIHMSSEETYGDFNSDLIDEDHPQKPISFYGLTKLAAEHYGRVYSRDHGLECINVRTCWVYGPCLPRLRVPRTFVEAALRSEELHLSEGADFAVDQVYIADTVAGTLLALDKPVHRFDSYNIATGVASTIADVAQAVINAIPGARITVGMDGAYKHGGVVVSAKKGALDIRRAVSELNYQPRYTLQQGIDATIEATRAELKRETK